MPLVMAANTQLSLQDPQVVQSQAKAAEAVNGEV